MDNNKLKSKLTPDELANIQEDGTEYPFTGKYLNVFDDGTYHCKVCESPLFPSDTKYKSTVPGLSGWPSFDDAIPGAVEFVPDYSAGLHRVEVVCSHCKTHLGHIFDDPEAKTGKHYCINSVCLELNDGKETHL